jgi:hypothetical protein
MRNCTCRHESDNTSLRIPECLSLRPNWLPPPPLLQASVSPLGTKDRQPLLAGEGMRGAISDDLRESLALCILCGLNRTVPTILRTYYPLQVYIDLQYFLKVGGISHSFCLFSIFFRTIQSFIHDTSIRRLSTLDSTLLLAQ